jgi:hypothetical protein
LLAFEGLSVSRDASIADDHCWPPLSLLMEGPMVTPF